MNDIQSSKSENADDVGIARKFTSKTISKLDVKSKRKELKVSIEFLEQQISELYLKLRR